MKYQELGKTGLVVSRLCFGSLTMGPLQAGFDPVEAGEILAFAFEKGVNFVDMAQLYGVYPYVREGLRRWGRDNIILTSKTYAYERQMALDAVDEARRALNRDVIDIFMLHEQESIHTLRGHKEALETLFDLRERGVIRAVGISTHHVAAIEGALTLADEGTPLDVVHPLYNMAGIGIADGTESDMANALTRLHDRGCGVFGMKSLGGGHLFRQAREAFRFVLAKPFIDAVAVGMQSEAEVDANLALFAGLDVPERATAAIGREKRLHIEEYCEGCGACVRRCPAGALTLADAPAEADENPYDHVNAFAAEAGIAEQAARKHAVCDPDKCVLCGYCTGVCPVFALKVY